MKSKNEKILIVVVIILSILLIGAVLTLVLMNINKNSEEEKIENKVDNIEKTDNNIVKQENTTSASNVTTSNNNVMVTPKFVDLGGYGPKVVKLRSFESGYIKCEKAEAYIYEDKIEIHITENLKENKYKTLTISDYSGKCIDVLYYHFMGSMNARDLYILLDDGTIDKYTIPYENYNINDVKFVRVGKLDNINNVVAIGQYFNKNTPYARKSDGSILVNFEEGRDAKNYDPRAVGLIGFEYVDFECEKAEALIYEDKVEINITANSEESKYKTLTISDYSGKCVDVIYRHFSGSSIARDLYLLLDDGTVDMYSMNSDGNYDINKVEFIRKGKLDIKNVVKIGISLNKNVPYAIFSDGTVQVPLTTKTI